MILKRKEKLNQEPKYWFNSRNILLLQKTGDTFFFSKTGMEDSLEIIINRSKFPKKEREGGWDKTNEGICLSLLQFLYLHDTKKYFCFCSMVI
jgi:hypothetical protein